MRGCRIPGLNKLREQYPTAEALGDVINRSRDYVNDRLLRKKEFTAREKKMILNDLGNRFGEEIFN